MTEEVHIYEEGAGAHTRVVMKYDEGASRVWREVTNLLTGVSRAEAEVPGVGTYATTDGVTWTMVRMELVHGGFRNGVDGAARFPVNDVQGSVRGFASAASGLSSAYGYYPYGQVHSMVDESGVGSERWQSKEWDEEYEFYYFGARYFDPIFGQWTSPDPAGQFANPYAYGGDPVNGRDPDGRLFIADSWVFGFTQRLIQTGSPTKAWNEANHRAVSDVKIWGGLFAVDTDRGIGGAAWQLISRFTWEAPQTIVGFAAAHANNLVGNVKDVGYYKGSSIIETRTGNGNRQWGYTISNYITTSRDPAKDLIKHEYGHTLQSQIVGPAYLPFVALPSLASASLNGDSHNHHDYWTEIWSDNLTGWYHDENDFHDAFSHGKVQKPHDSCNLFLSIQTMCNVMHTTGETLTGGSLK